MRGTAQRGSIFLTVLVLLAAACGSSGGDDATADSATTTSSTSGESEGSEEVQDPSSGRFGFLCCPEQSEYRRIHETTATWIRPHPGPFIWGKIQAGPNDEYDFSEADETVTAADENDFSVLATLWPYAEWDQLQRPDAESCRVDTEEFVIDFGSYRCNPSDWDAYERWVTAVVERYDGDGEDDMPGLGTKVQFWEVNNEPDLTGGPDGTGLVFYRSGPAGYRELLKRTSAAIKAADPTAQVLIAGAAGGDPQSLDFYREVLADESVRDAFDIANVHCISGGAIDSLNVEPYQAMLTELGIDKPVWVTEAETFVSDDPTLNATQLRASTERAIELGAERIFFTTPSFTKRPGGDEGPPKTPFDIEPDLAGDDPIEIYRKIITSIEAAYPS